MAGGVFKKKKTGRVPTSRAGKYKKTKKGGGDLFVRAKKADTAARKSGCSIF